MLMLMLMLTTFVQLSNVIGLIITVQFELEVCVPGSSPAVSHQGRPRCTSSETSSETHSLQRLTQEQSYLRWPVPSLASFIHLLCLPVLHGPHINLNSSSSRVVEALTAASCN